MTRKDFVKIAEILGLLDAEAVDAKRTEIDAILRGENVNYKAGTFWDAVEHNRA